MEPVLCLHTKTNGFVPCQIRPKRTRFHLIQCKHCPKMQLKYKPASIILTLLTSPCSCRVWVTPVYIICINFLSSFQLSSLRKKTFDRPATSLRVLFKVNLLQKNGFHIYFCWSYAGTCLF